MRIEDVKTLYHGTAEYHDKIDLSKGSRFKDFGQGYYLTSSYNQAYSWAKNKGNNSRRCWIYQYELKALPKETSVLELYEYNTSWLEVVASCRIKGTVYDYDIICDRMADNHIPTLSNAIRNFSNGFLSAEDTLKIVKFEKPKKRDQFCFKTYSAVNLLERISIIELELRDDNTWHNVEQ